MKSAEEWRSIFDNNFVSDDFLVEFVKDIQSDAFHAGKLEGLAVAKKIIKAYGGSDNDAPNQAARQIAFEMAKKSNVEDVIDRANEAKYFKP